MRAQPVNGAMQTDLLDGTCLYLGADGKRCFRPAAIGGFCEKHDPERSSRHAVSLVRVAAALMLLWVLLWPVIADAVRELRRWLK